jgi:hypothetical protein
MRSNILSTSIALLLLGSHEVSAQDASYHSFGQVTSCQTNIPSNTTHFNMSISPSNATLSLNVTNLPTFPGNATVSIAVLAAGDEVFKTTLDPCTLSIPELCPASGDPANLTANMAIPEAKMRAMDLSSRAEVKGRISIDIHGMDSSTHSSCVETALRSDASDAGNGTTGSEGGASGNGTTGSDDGNSTNGTANGDGSDASGTTQASSASALQAGSYMAM